MTLRYSRPLQLSGVAKDLTALTYLSHTYTTIALHNTKSNSVTNFARFRHLGDFLHLEQASNASIAVGI